MSSTTHFTVLYHSYKFRTHALTPRLCFFFAVLKIMKSMAITLEVCILEHDSLSRIAQRIDPHTSARFCAFNTNYLNNAARFF